MYKFTKGHFITAKMFFFWGQLGGKGKGTKAALFPLFSGAAHGKHQLVTLLSLTMWVYLHSSFTHGRREMQAIVQQSAQWLFKVIQDC